MRTTSGERVQRLVWVFIRKALNCLLTLSRLQATLAVKNYFRVMLTFNRSDDILLLTSNRGTTLLPSRSQKFNTAHSTVWF